MVRETVLAAVVAGLIAALVFTVVQSIWITPLIHQGEVYEEAAEHSHVEAHEHHTDAHADAHEGAHEAGGHHHDDDEWKPEDGWQRTLFTFGANLLMGVGYAFVLVALYLLWREPRNALAGAVYGLAGFLVFFAAPAVGLPPDLPGTAAAELSVRQQWWAMTAVATAVGLFLLFSQGRWSLRILGILIVIAPHFVPAPQPAVELSLAPAELQTQFRVATTIANAVFWVALGIASGVAFRKLVAGGSRAQA